MFVPVINTASYRRHVTIINKNIIYTDTVLSLKDLGENIKVTSISGIDEYNFEECLRTILEANASVTFNTVQYSKAENKIYFYTNDAINTAVWEDKKYRLYEPITRKDDIIFEVESVLSELEPASDDCVSALEVYSVIKTIKDKVNTIESNYAELIETVARTHIASKANVIVSGIDYKRDILIIRFSYSNFDFKNIEFVKENGDLRISRSESIYGMDILECAPETLSKLYDELIAFKPYLTSFSKIINSTNSRFKVDVDPRYGVDVFISSPDNQYKNEIFINKRTFTEPNEYDVNCNSTAVMEVLKGKASLLYKNIYVNIEDCPQCIKELLYELKRRQKENEDKKNNPKRLNLLTKLKNWLLEE